MCRPIIAAMLCTSMSVTGCASLGDNQVLAATLILNQLDATLDSVEIALTELQGEAPDSDAFKALQITLKVAKPQIIAWIDTISQIKAAQGQYEEAQELKARADALMPQIDVAIQ